MAHAKLNLQRMLTWIEGQIAANGPLPTDNQICDHFGFSSTEQARTLLAELADAGKITICGYGADRTIQLGRVRAAAAPIARPAPPVGRADADVEAAAAKIAAIVSRGRAATSAAINAGAILATHTPKPAAIAAPQPPQEETMAGKSISLPASASKAIGAVERRAQAYNIPIGQAAAELIEAGLQPASAPSTQAGAVELAEVSADELLAELGRRFDAARSADALLADLAEANAARDTAIAAQEAAEARVAKMRAALDA